MRIHFNFLGIVFFLTISLSFSVGAESKITELTMALNTEFETLNPNVNSMMAAIYVQDATLRPLVALTPEGKPKAHLIKEIPSLEKKTAQLIGTGSQKGLKAKIEILENAKWGDGKPVTCEDLKTSWQIGIHPNTSNPERSTAENISDIEIDAKNSKKCSIIFKEAKWNFYLNFPRPIASHIEGPIFEKFKNTAQAYERNSSYIRDLANPGLYNGPYRVSEVKIGSHAILVPNDHFYGKKPKFSKLIFKFILNTATIEANLRAGTVNMTTASGMSFDQAVAFEKKVKADQLPFDVHFTTGASYTVMTFNMDKPPLDDIQIRRAFAHSINSAQMVKAFFEGKQQKAFHFSSPTDSWFTEDPKDIMIYSYDRKKAEALFDKAGWKSGPDGYRYKDGKKLSVTISGAAENKVGELTEAFIQDQLKNVGVELLIKNYPTRVLFSEILRQRKFELGLSSLISVPDAMTRTLMHSSMIPTAENSWSGVNRAGWKNTKVDRWIDEVEVEFNSQKRIGIMRKIIKAYTEDLPALPLYYRATVSVTPKGLKNYNLSGHSHSEYLSVEDWTF